MSQITVESYSEKAIAVFGDTKLIKDSLLELKGKFNPSLKGANGSDEKRAGWIFPKTRLDDVKKLVESAKNGTLVQPSASSSSTTQSSSTSTTSYKKKETQVGEFQFSKEMYLALVSRIERLEQEIKLSNTIIQTLTGKSVKQTVSSVAQKTPQINFESDGELSISSESEEEEEEEEEKKPPRLLKRNK